MPKRRRPASSEQNLGKNLNSQQFSSVDTFRDSLQFIEEVERALLPLGEAKDTVSFETDALKEPSVKDQIQKAIEDSIKSKQKVERGLYDQLVDDFEDRWVSQAEYIQKHADKLQENAYTQSRNVANGAARRALRLTIENSKANAAEAALSSKPRTLTSDSIVLTISVYDSNDPKTPFQKFLVHEDTLLDDFRASLYCQHKAFTVNGRQGSYVTNSEVIYIGDSFFYKGSLGEKYAKRLSAWVASAEAWTADTELVDMSDISFRMISSFKLGQRYLYSHCFGRCEHTFTVDSLQRFHPSCMPEQMDSFPYLLFQKPLRRRNCEVCRLVSARYTCYGTSIDSGEPLLYCDHCVRTLLYTESSSLNSLGKEGQVRIFPYYHD